MSNEQRVRAALGSGGSCWAGFGDTPKVFRIWSRALPGTTDPRSVLLGTGGSPEEAWHSATSHPYVADYERTHRAATLTGSDMQISIAKCVGRLQRAQDRPTSSTIRKWEEWTELLGELVIETQGELLARIRELEAQP